MKKLVNLFVIISALSLLLSACGSNPEETATAEVNVQPLGVIAEGRLAPVNSLYQSFLIGGQVAEVLVADGESVSAGQVLARLVSTPETAVALVRAEQEVLAANQAIEALRDYADTSLAQSKVDHVNAETALEEAQTNFDTDDSEENRALLDAATAAYEMAVNVLSTLEGNDGIDPDLMEAAQVRLEAANVGLLSAQTMMEAYELKATLDGVVVDLTLQAGELVSAGAPVMLIADTTEWVIKTDNLTEIDVTGVSVGQKVEVVLDALPELTLSGEVSHINALYEEKRGDITYTVTILLTETDPSMRWGMTAAVSFVP